MLALLCGVAGTAALFVAVRGHEQREEELEFQQRANVRTAAIRQGLNAAVEALDSVGRLFGTLAAVDREQFRSFTAPLLVRYPYIQAFNHHRIVSAEELPAYVAGMRTLHPDYSVQEMAGGNRIPASPKERYYVVDYVEPLLGNEPALGLDVSPNAQLMRAVMRSVDSGLPQASGLLVLAQGKGRRNGFLVVTPVYRRGMPLTDVVERRQAFVGDIAAVFRGGDLVERILADGGFLNSPDIGISVYAASRPEESELVFRRGDAPHFERPAAFPMQRLFYDRLKPAERSFDIAGTTWTVVLTKKPMWFGYNHRGSTLVLVTGIVFTLLAAAYLQSVSLRARRVQKLVDLRTAELQRANALLVEDIAARKQAEKALQLRQRAIDSSANAIMLIRAEKPDYIVDDVNPAFERMTGYGRSEIIGQSYHILQADYRDQPGIEEIRGAMREQREGYARLRSYRKDGSLFWNDLYISPVRDAAGKVSHFVVTQYDITAAKRYEAELEYQANRDALTGLANRNLLRDRLGQALAYAGRYGHSVWIVLVDLDRFKFINDTLGHKAGDALLNKVAERLLQAVRETDTVARLGGDDFVLILPERSDERLTMGAVQRIMQAVSRPLVIEGHEFFPTCSTGVSAYPADGQDADTLIKHAEIAMYRAKENGRNTVQFYTSAMNAEALERLKLEGSLRSAVEREEFILHYQPQVDLASGRVTGMESLIRWQHPELGMVPPGRFIGLAEETGLIVPIGSWAIRTACAQAKSLQNQGFGQLRVAVNLSARQFYQHDLVKTVATALNEAELAPDCLEIELTESLVMTDVERAIAVLRDLKALGVQISIDDFGTGYSSLSYLKRFPIDVLKIDQSFVRDITEDADDAAIVLSIISLAHSLRLKVIAEGVETAEQLAYLRQHGCDQIQGYYFSKPLPAPALQSLLAEGKSLPPAQHCADALRTRIA
ncbi:MAG TPA: EAL domain-containing protein [Paucimonas sp.]|nr:EAL domain-containing protein [Paucimonas sp.]